MRSRPMVPTTLRTARLHLRPWAATDAARLQPILEANLAHLGPWIPAHVATPLPVPELAGRLTGFADDFTAGRAYRFALLTPDGTKVLGEVDLSRGVRRGACVWRTPIASSSVTGSMPQ